MIETNVKRVGMLWAICLRERNDILGINLEIYRIEGIAKKLETDAEDIYAQFKDRGAIRFNVTKNETVLGWMNKADALAALNVLDHLVLMAEMRNR